MKKRIYTITIASSLSVLAFFIIMPGWLGADQGEKASLSQLKFPIENLPSPHNPFWVNTHKLGFVAERAIKSKRAGAMYIYDLQTKTMQKLIDRPTLFPAFLPKANRISFVDVGKNKSLTLFTASLRGDDIKEFSFQGFAVFTPDWSPDDTRVVFSNLSYDAQLMIADIQRDHLEELGSLGRGIETEGVEAPDWSPQGKDIIYVGWDKSSRLPDGGYMPTIGRIYKFDLEKSRYYRLTEGSFRDEHPAYSPDGRYIAFVSNRSGQAELWTMNNDGTDLRQLTYMAERGYELVEDKPAWSPDQKKIAFAARPTKPQPIRDKAYFQDSSIWILYLP